MENKDTFGYGHEEEAQNCINDTSRYGTSANIPVLAVAHAELASLEVQRKIASILIDIEVAIRELTKTLEKNRKEE